jgi:hypothetical protein
MRVGLGLNPGDPCYDQDRPSWLPYWFNDVAESECESGTNNILSAAFSDIGQQGAAAVTGAASALASGAASGVSAGLSNFTLGGSVLAIGAIAVVALVVLMAVEK